MTITRSGCQGSPDYPAVDGDRRSHNLQVVWEIDREEINVSVTVIIIILLFLLWREEGRASTSSSPVGIELAHSVCNPLLLHPHSLGPLGLPHVEELLPRLLVGEGVASALVELDPKQIKILIMNSDLCISRKVTKYLQCELYFFAFEGGEGVVIHYADFSNYLI